MKKRITALLLSLLMILTAFPVTTWAAEGTGSVGSTTDYLNETERQIYTQLKSIIEQQAVKGGRMEFGFTVCQSRSRWRMAQTRTRSIKRLVTTLTRISIQERYSAVLCWICHTICTGMIK